MNIYRYEDGKWKNSALLAYITSVACVGFYLSIHADLTLTGVCFFMIATALLSHSFVLAAYFTHECMHNSIFKKMRNNDVAGTFFCFILGSAFYPYSRLKEKHFRHHSERRDVIAIDLCQYFSAHPKIHKWVTRLQWLHLPAAEIYSHSLAVAAPLYDENLKQFKLRILAVLAIYVSILALLTFASIGAVTSYLTSLICTYGVLGFMDTFQHTYAIKLSLNNIKEKPSENRQYEEDNTYSNLLSRRYPFINLLVLNFCYHNIHHQKSGEPWYRLPKLHANKYPDQCPQEIGLGTQIAYFHKHRLTRIQHQNRSGISRLEVGASGVSFLVGV